VDGWALAFAAGCATLTTMVFGSMAALFARGDLASGLKDGGRASSDRKRHIARSALIAAQVAFSFVLLTGAGLMVRSFLRLQAVDPGFVPERVFALRFNLNWSKYNGSKEYAEVSRRILERAQAQPGVVAAAVATGFPMDPDLNPSGAGRPLRFRVEGDPRPDSESPPIRLGRSVTTDYFKALGIPVLSGRAFNEFDRGKPEVIIISRSIAAKRFPREDPVGKRLTFDNGETWYQIVGVVGDVKDYGLTHETPYTVYEPLEQTPHPGALVARAAGDAASIGGLLRRAVVDVDPDTAIVRFETLEQAREDSVASPRTLTRVFAGFAGLAFVIAVAGIASMLALWVRQRRREIGIRMALGASPRTIVGEVVRQGMVLAGVGLAIGIAAALELTRWMKALLFEIEPTDVTTFAAIAGMLIAAALAACLVPARKASRIDPQMALRAD
jgi:putative ABC transport system permease protein